MPVYHGARKCPNKTGKSNIQVTLLSNEVTILNLCFQTCLNDQLHKATTRLSRPVLSPPKQIPLQSLLYKTTTCLTRPATTFFVSQMKKNLSKATATKLYPTKKWKTIKDKE